MSGFATGMAIVTETETVIGVEIAGNRTRKRS
jgi:hypothetical protein